MIAMQYRFTLPADYDMSIIERRIRDKGPLLDRFPGLGFKAYLYAVADDTATGGRENLYAPFWRLQRSSVWTWRTTQRPAATKISMPHSTSGRTTKV